jgi:hypothetical protein
MRALEFLTESERTLYHGTLAANVPAILRFGIIPKAGDFVQGFYGWDDEDELDELVFAADKSGLKKCVAAILGYLRIKGIDRTEENFFRYGALCVMRNQQNEFEPHDDWGDNPSQVEPGDYFTRNTIRADYILVRDKLRSFLRRNGVGVRV